MKAFPDCVRMQLKTCVFNHKGRDSRTTVIGAICSDTGAIWVHCTSLNWNLGVMAPIRVSRSIFFGINYVNAMVEYNCILQWLSSKEFAQLWHYAETPHVKTQLEILKPCKYTSKNTRIQQLICSKINWKNTLRHTYTSFSLIGY